MTRSCYTCPRCGATLAWVKPGRVRVELAAVRRATLYPRRGEVRLVCAACGQDRTIRPGQHEVVIGEDAA